MPKVSVLMPVCNAAKFLDESIQSVLNQTFTDFDFLILDDASKDTSLNIIQKYKEKNNRIKVFRVPKNLGQVGSKNFLLGKVSGEYIAWIDADDIFHPKKLQTQLDFLKENPSVQVVGTWAKKISRNQSFTFPQPIGHYNIVANFLLWNSIIQPSSLFHHSLVTERKIKYNKIFNAAEDYQFWIQTKKFIQFGNIAKPLIYYRIHQKQESSKNSKKQTEAHLKIIKHNLQAKNISCNNNILSQFLFFYSASEINKEKVLELVQNILTINRNSTFFSNYFENKVIRQYYKYLRYFFPANYKKIFFKSFFLKNFISLKFFPTIERYCFYKTGDKFIKP